MKLRVWTAITIFLGSYLPLSVILLAQDFDYSYFANGFCFNFFDANTQCKVPFKNPRASISIFIICLLCLLVTISTLQVVKMNTTSIILSTKHIPAELMNYTLPYVVSFMGMGAKFGEPTPDKLIGISIFMIWIFWITYKSGQIILNPVLVAFGWRLHEVEYRFEGSSSKLTTVALIKGEVELGSRIKHNWIEDVMISRQG